MITLVFGTRPEYIKLKSIISEFKKRNIKHHIIFVRQHDTSFAGIADDEINALVDIPNSGENRLNTIQSTILQNIVFPKGTQLVLVHGDTATSFAAALAAYNQQIPIVHIEAGLRTHDLENPYPEEGYRQLIDRLSTYRFCPTVQEALNLQQEKLIEHNYVVGNTVIDNLPSILPEKTQDIYITLHRRENHSILSNWFAELEKLANMQPTYNFFFIKHPNPHVMKHISLLKKVKVIEPFSHDEMIEIIAKKCCLFISDSGGIQEEAARYNKPILVCRKHTERMHPGVFLVNHPNKLNSSFDIAIQKNIVDTKTWFGMGDSGKQIVDILMRKVINL